MFHVGSASIAAFHQAVVATNLLAFSDPPGLVELSTVPKSSRNSKGWIAQFIPVLCFTELV